MKLPDKVQMHGCCDESFFAGDRLQKSYFTKHDSHIFIFYGEFLPINYFDIIETY